MSNLRLSDELRHIIGDDAFMKLLEKKAGIRLYMPRDGDELARLIGRENVSQLAERYAGSYIRVPLAREFRVRAYREAGLSNAKIALRLGVTETAVDKILAKMTEKPVKGAQLDLFRGEACRDDGQTA